MNDFFEFIFAFGVGLIGCIVVGSIFNWLIPLH